MNDQNKPDGSGSSASVVPLKDELPTLRPPVRQAQRVSLTRYLAPRDDAFARKLWAEYQAYCRRRDLNL